MTARRGERRTGREKGRKMAGRAPGDLVSKKNTTSAVWEYFGFQANEKGEPVNTDEAICKLCYKKVTARDAITSNLRTHLRVNHPLTAARMNLAPSSLSATVSRPPTDTDAGPTTTKSTASYTQATIMGPSPKQQSTKGTVSVGKPATCQQFCNAT